MDEIIEVLGIISLIGLIIVFASGMLMKYRRRSLFPVHRWFAFLLFILALAHGIFALLS